MQHTAVDICNAGLDAVEILASIGANSFRDAYAAHSEPADLEAHVQEFFSVDAIRGCIERQESRYLLASVNRQPGGIARYRIAPCPVPGGALQALELQQLYVMAGQQRQGLGRRLIRSLLEEARQQKLAGIWLSCWEDADWALKFYRKNGFVRVGTADFAVGATIYCDYLMWLDLPAEGRRTAPHSST